MLFALVAAAAERNAASCEPEPERAPAGLRRSELSAWTLVALSLIWPLAWFASPTIFIALASACTSVAVDTIFAGAAVCTAAAGLLALVLLRTRTAPS